MTFEELKAEANAQGYNLIKRKNKEKLLPCTCGCKKRTHYSCWNGDGHSIRLVCYKCGKKASGDNEIEAAHNWNEMIKEEVKDGPIY